MIKRISMSLLFAAVAGCSGGGASDSSNTPPAPPPLPPLPPNGVVFGDSPAQAVPLSEARFSYPEDAIEADDGAIYVSDSKSHVIRRAKDGMVTVFAGTFAAGYNGDGEKTKVKLNTPTGLQLSADQKFLFFADSGNNLIRRIDLATGFISTIAGKPGNTNLPVDNALARGNPIGYSVSMRLDGAGNLWIPVTSEKKDSSVGALYWIDPQGRIHNKPVTGISEFTRVRDLDVQPLYLDFVLNTYFIRAYTTGEIGLVQMDTSFGKGIVRDGDATLLGNHTTLLSVNNELIPSVVASGFANLSNVRKAKEGFLLTDSDQGVLYRYVNGVVTQITGTSPASFGALVSVIKYGENKVLVLDNQRPRIFLLDLTSGQSTLWAGSGIQGWANPALDKSLTNFYYPNALAADAEKNVYVAEQHRILKITPAGVVSILAGSEYAGDADGAPGFNRFRSPGSICVDASGALIVADTYNNKIRKIDKDGVVTTVAGTGAMALPTLEAQAGASALNHPLGVAVMPDGALLIADGWNNAVYRMSTDGVLHAFAGKPNRTGYQGGGTLSGDGAAATLAGLNTPAALGVRDGTVYITDSFNHRLRAVGPDGLIRTIAGSVQGFMPGGRMLSFPRDIAILDNQVLVADTGNRNIVRYYVR